MESSARPMLGTFLIVFAAMGGLFVIDTLLADADQSARRSEARRLYREGQLAARQDRLTQAIDDFRGALSNSRENRDYQLALAQALQKAGRTQEAESNFTELLARDSTDGAANLAMARLLISQKRIPQAISYYHRAIYGQWKEDASGNQVRARFELVDLLAGQGQKRELLAELLPLQDEASSDVQTRMRIGRLFLAAGAPNRAAEVFRSVLRREPGDADAYAGFGEAEFALGNYRAAQADFQIASRARPGDARIASRLALCTQVLGLDPMRRGISARERRERSRKLLDLALAEARACGGPTPAHPMAELMEQARRPPADFEANLELAERLWQARRSQCGPVASPNEQALALLMSKLAQ